MLRRIGLSILLLVSLVVMVPVITSTAHNLRAHFSSHARHRRHSRAWWRRHRALVRRRQAMLARRRALIAARRAGGEIPSVPARTAENHVVLSTAVTNPAGSESMALPSGWSQASSTNGAANYRISPANGGDAYATLAVVAPSSSSPQPFGRQQRNMVGGASFTDLRRSVIDRMISAGGWVVNDRQRDISGRKVFEVVAQTPSENGKPDQVWNFYFTEVNGRVYSLTTRSAGANDKVAADAEKFLGGFTPAEQRK
jgi:hypothetical protein